MPAEPCGRMGNREKAQATQHPQAAGPQAGMVHCIAAPDPGRRFAVRDVLALLGPETGPGLLRQDPEVAPQHALREAHISLIYCG